MSLRMALIMRAAGIIATAAPVRVSAAAGTDAAGEERRPEGKWEADVRATTLVHAWGFQPSRIVSSTDNYDVDGRRLENTQGRFLIKGAVRGRYLHWDFEPFTDVPPSTGHGYHVNTIGLATALYVPLGKTWRIGAYHYSAHNVADGAYGFGADLNALTVDATPVDGPLRLGGLSGWQGLRLHAHWYLIDRGSPWVLTRETRLESGGVGRVRIRTGFDYAFAGVGLRGECGGYGTVSSGGRVGSVNLECAALWRLDAPFLGALGEHLMAGPFLNCSRNLTRVETLGPGYANAGFRIDVLVSEDRSAKRSLW